MTIRILIAEDEPLMRSALRDCFSTESDMEVVAVVADGQRAVEAAEALKPDVVILDIRMPVMDGVEATRHLVNAGPDAPKVVVVTTFGLDEYIVSALRVGASAFLLKDITPDELVRAVRTVAAGDALLAPAVTRRLLERYSRFLPSQPPAQTADLTPRELAVLRLVARGESNTQIASELFLAESSVKTHIGHLLKKLRVHDRVHLVIYAYESGLIRPQERLSE